jgi:uncharacterized protein YeeX (DUF496 family)
MTMTDAKTYLMQVELYDTHINNKLEELAREVREHNHFARRMPVVEEQIRVANHRIADLENLHKGKEQ